MPLMNFIDNDGSTFYQFGKSGHRYYYNPNSQRSELIARNKALKQGRAIKASKK